MNSRWKNIGMWLSTIAATSTAVGAYLVSPTQEIKIGIITGLVTTIAGIISNPKEGAGYLDK